MPTPWLEPEALTRAWNRVRENDGCAGADGVTVQHFACQLDAEWDELKQCVEHGQYRALPLLVEVMLDYGNRVEESVFECTLEAQLAAKMTDRIRKVVDTEEDKVLVYGLCEACAQKTLVIGPVERPRDAEFYIL